MLFHIKSVRFVTSVVIGAGCFLFSGGIATAQPDVRISPTKAVNADAFDPSNFANDSIVLLESSGDTLIAAWLRTDFPSYESMLVSRSTDGGFSWSTPVAPPGLGSGTYLLAHVSGKNWSLVNTSSNTVSRSTDDGVTWSAPEAMNTGGFLLDPYPPTLVSNRAGLLLTVLQGTTLNPSTVISSSDGGVNWTTAGSMPAHTIKKLVHSGGSNWVCYTKDTSSQVFVSPDNGFTWNPVSLPLSLPRASDVGLSSNQSGTVLLTWGENSVSQLPGVITSHFQTYLLRSDDHGMTWSSSKRIHNNDMAINGTERPSRVTTYQYPLWMGGDEWRLFILDFSAGTMSSVMNGAMSMVTTDDGGLNWSDTFELDDDTGSWTTRIDPAASSEAYQFAVAGTNCIGMWAINDLTINGQSSGLDNDIFYRVIRVGPTAAHNWQMFH